MGALDHLSDLCSMTETKEAIKLRKKRPLQVRFVEFKEHMCALTCSFIGLIISWNQFHLFSVV